MRRLAALALLFIPALAWSNDCRYTAERALDVDAAGIQTLAVDLGSSDLVVEGVPGLKRIEIRGKACASQQDWLDQLGVDQRRDGNRVVVTPRLPDRGVGGWFGSSYAYIDLHVRVPTALAVAVDGSSGDVEANDVAALDFSSSSGDLKAGHIAGELGVEVSSGDVRAHDLGSADVRGTSSGDITLRDVHGDVAIARSGSGDIGLHTVGGVRIGGVGSGDVLIVDAAGDVTIESIGSGDVNVDGVAGSLRVGSHGSGDVRYSGVKGRVDVPSDDD